MRWDEQKLKIFDVDGQVSESGQGRQRPVTPDLLVQHASTIEGSEELPLPDDGRDSTIQRMLAQYLAETYGRVFELERIDPRDSPAGKRILASSPRVLRIYLGAVLQMILDPPGGRGAQLQPLLTAILRRVVNWDEGLLCHLVSKLSGYTGRYLWPLPTAGVVRLVERYLVDHPLSPPLRSALEDLRRLYKVRAEISEERTIFRRLNRLLSSTEAPDAPLEYCTGEAWTLALTAAVNTQPPEQRARWRALLDHAATAKSPQPRAAWLKQAAVLRDAVGAESFRRAIVDCFEAVGRAGNAEQFTAPFEHRADPSQVHEEYSDLLRGLLWCAGGARTDELVPIVGRAAERCFERIPGKLPRSLKIATASIQALALCRSRLALEELMRLQTRARQASIKKKLAAAIDELRQFVPEKANGFDDLCVPDLELTELGIYRYTIGRHTASIGIASPGTTRLVWQSGNAPPRRKVPAAVRSFHAADWAHVRKRHREIDTELPRLKLQLERLLIAGAQWDLPHFRHKYLDQPLVGPFARAMIWTLMTPRGEVSAIWHDDQWRDRAHRVVPDIDDRTRVRPWHPLTAEPTEVLDWQCYLEDQGICQPFKQAHREIYRPLPEEAGDAWHSERFASHLVDSYRLEQIVPERGWSFRDTSALATLHSPELELVGWNLRARWITQPYSDVERRELAAPNSHGVMFETLDTAQAVSVAEVPAVVYSEVMRDIECFFIQYGAFENFVGHYETACNEWMRDYWLRMALGPLSIQGQVRKAVIQRLLPRSRLARCAKVCGDCLQVDGERNRYHVHLGSGTVQMGRERRILHPFGYAFTREHLGLPPANAFPRLPFGGDIRLASILRDAARLAHESRISEQQLLEQIADE